MNQHDKNEHVADAIAVTGAIPISSEPAAHSAAREGPFYIVMNAGSGHQDADALELAMARVFDAASRRFVVLRVEKPEQIVQVAKEAVAKALADNGVVVAAGGDGTINAVAGAVLHSGCPFGVLPQGTFNYFGRVNGIAQDTEAAAEALLHAHIEPVQVGLVNGRVFLVNASLGLYPQLLEDREAWKSTLGRSRLVAFLSGVSTLLRARQQLSLHIDSAADPGTAVPSSRPLRTPTLFVGNNQLQLTRVGIDPAHADAVTQGQLAAVVIRPVGTWAILGLMLKGLVGQLGNADNVDTFTFERLTVMPKGRRRIKVATDGEICWLPTPLVFEVATTPLLLMVPSSADRVAVE